ncbi:hypothetical protein OsccyDRAFT_3709 [Leptolyngbyaceae cyanobacterium JSC-12]|nr:hypothetical protein OsccyDRAFT_3709 [Leptolyngbyaceae cyanobacterium JSC-12]
MDSWTRILKSAYRKQPIISFMITVGTVNVAVGGLGEHWSLMSLGFSVVGIAIALGVRQKYARKRPLEPQNRPPVYILPPSSAGLPMLSMSKKNPPGR